MQTTYRFFAPSGKVPYLGDTPGELYCRLKSERIEVTSFRAENASEDPRQGMRFTISGPQIELTARVDMVYRRMAAIGNLKIGDDSGIDPSHVIQVLKTFFIR